MGDCLVKNKMTFFPDDVGITIASPNEESGITTTPVEEKTTSTSVDEEVADVRQEFF